MHASARDVLERGYDHLRAEHRELVVQGLRVVLRRNRHRVLREQRPGIEPRPPSA
jgi:hypothetical protein